MNNFRITTHENGGDCVDMEVLHLATGIFATGSGRSRTKLKRELMALINKRLHTQKETASDE